MNYLEMNKIESDGFAAPELRYVHEILYPLATARADVWSAGAIAYMLMFGYHPFYLGLSARDAKIMYVNNLILPIDLLNKC